MAADVAVADAPERPPPSPRHALMLLDVMLTGDVAGVPQLARRLEALGADGIFAAETNRDPFGPLMLAGEHTTTPQVGTSIAVAFARTPMVLAYQAAGLASVAPGRVVVGLGAQVRAHVTKRFGMPWTEPAARMREYVLAVQAIWDTWTTGAPLAFRGRFYRHTLMPPFFAPDLGEGNRLALYVAGTGRRMTEVAAEVADGFVFHLFTTPEHLRAVSLPAVAAGLARSGRTRGDLTIAGHTLLVSGTGPEMDKLREAARAQLAFYASTSAYLPVLKRHGLTDVHTAARRLVLRGQWDDLATVVDDEIVETFATVGRPDDVPDLLARRYGGIADRLCVPLPPSALQDPGRWREVIAAIHDIPGPAAHPTGPEPRPLGGTHVPR